MQHRSSSSSRCSREKLNVSKCYNSVLKLTCKYRSCFSCLVYFHEQATHFGTFQAEHSTSTTHLFQLVLRKVKTEWNTSPTCAALINLNMEKVYQESLIYQEKFFANKIPSLTMWCPWILPLNQKFLLHKLCPERKIWSSRVRVHYTVFHTGKIFKGTCLVIGRFLLVEGYVSGTNQFQK